jgi:NAD(P)-dependent dehydrogenase (short-subunit alcohol dehydrogenase family)
MNEFAGIGLEFVRQLLERPGHVIATCRNPAAATGLQELAAAHGSRLSIVRMDTTSESSIADAAAQVAEIQSHIDMLLNVSGVLHTRNNPDIGLMLPETNLQRCTLENLQRSFATNAFGPLLVSKAFIALLNAAGGTEQHPAIIANMSARVGSIGDNRLGGWYSYRASKAALNQLTKTMSVELARKKEKVAAVLLHPGTTDTELSEPFQRNVAPEKLFSKERSVRQMLGILDKVTMADTGTFYAWDGSIIPW